MSMIYKYGIDFGTTNSSISLVMQDANGIKYTKVFEVYRHDTPYELIRSVVGYKDSEIFVGENGLSYLTGVKDNPIKQVKMKLLTAEFDKEVATVNNKKIYCSDVMAEILKEMKKAADAQNKGCVVDGVVMGVPNGTKECVKAVYLTALVKAGFFRNEQEAALKTDFLEESIAVALFYGTKRGLNAKKALIFDFGGGTLDMAVVDMKEQSLNDSKITPHEVIKKGEKAGAGEEFTKLLFTEVFVPAYADKYFGGDKYKVTEMFADLGVETGKDLSSLWKRMVTKGGPVWTFIKELDKAKILLSSREFCNFYLYIDETEEHDEIEFKEVTLKRSDFEKAIKDELADIDDVIDDMLRGAQPKFNNEDIGIVLLAGGSSMIPCVKKLLINKFGEDKVHFDAELKGSTYINVMTSISQGLAYAGYRNKEAIKDITSFDYGLMDHEKKQIAVVIPKGTKYEDALFCKDVTRKTFKVDVEGVGGNASKFFLDIYEGNNKILTLTYDKEEHSGKYRVFFSIDDKKGLLRVDVLDLEYSEWLTDVSEEERKIKMNKENKL